MSWQDYRGWRTQVLDEPRPKLCWRDFSDREYARSELIKLKASGFEACLTVMPEPKPRKLQRLPLLPLRFPKNQDENDGEDMTLDADRG